MPTRRRRTYEVVAVLPACGRYAVRPVDDESPIIPDTVTTSLDEALLTAEFMHHRDALVEAEQWIRDNTHRVTAAEPSRVLATHAHTIVTAYQRLHGLGAPTYSAPMTKNKRVDY